MADLFSLALDKADKGIIIIDSDQNIVFWNKYIERISHRSASVSLHRNLKNVVGIFSASLYQSALNAVLINNQSRFFSSKLHKAFILPENSEYVEIRQNMKIEPITFDNSVYALIQIEDITNEVSREHKLTSLLSELQKGYEEVKESEKVSKTLAETDSLTGLYNRYFITQKINELLNNKENFSSFSLFFVDLDGFKSINDTYGHDIGDAVLTKIGEKLQSVIKEEDVVSRIGGDEFVLLCRSNDKRKLSAFVENLMVKISKPFKVDELTICITASIGIYIITDDISSIAEVVKKADLAMYEAKKQGKNRFIFYN